MVAFISASVLDQEAIAASEFVVIEDDSKFLKVRRKLCCRYVDMYVCMYDQYLKSIFLYMYIYARMWEILYVCKKNYLLYCKFVFIYVCICLCVYL